MLRLISLALASLATFTAQAADIPAPPALSVKSYILKDFNSRQEIAGQNAAMRVEPASLTKDMTAYLTFKALKNGHLKLDQNLPVSQKAWKVEGSKMFIEPNKPVNVDELLHGLIIQSGNDAATALAEGVAGDEGAFANMMNTEAQRLGMKGSHFMNATGLPDPQHYTTAEDMATLAMALIRDFPEEYKRLYAIKEYTYNKITQQNRNRLLWMDPNVDGVKTGHTETAGFCLVASAKRGDMRLVSVVLGAPTEPARATESQKLLNYGFQFYESSVVYKKGQSISELKVWKGDKPILAATVADDLVLTLPKGDYKRIKAKMTSKQPLIAPIQAGQEVGTVDFVLDDKIVAQRKLVAAQTVVAGSFFSRIIDSIKLMLQ